MKLTPQQYADKLIEQYYALIPRFGDFKKNWKIAIEMSIIDVQNTIDANPTIYKERSGIIKSTEGQFFTISNTEYYQEVKQILENKL